MDVVPHSWPVQNSCLDCATLLDLIWDTVSCRVPPMVGVVQHRASLLAAAPSTNYLFFAEAADFLL